MSSSTLDTRTRKMIDRAAQLADMQDMALEADLDALLEDMERIETYAYHMAEQVDDVFDKLR